ncbi:hypothetical protein AQUCO_09500022v1 [Aquilegia coerulea]|uniref:Uncharacterized protein n=1 Tax=Aquilegia coerulea TaxID=218851 RepID=A0A2G5C4R9_AQUCA|nr:hypothetical protein AQUCO_09500022v1 [Aquilegia coerulea]
MPISYTCRRISKAILFKCGLTHSMLLIVDKLARRHRFRDSILSNNTKTVLHHFSCSLSKPTYLGGLDSPSISPMNAKASWTLIYQRFVPNRG